MNSAPTKDQQNCLIYLGIWYARALSSDAGTTRGSHVPKHGGTHGNVILAKCLSLQWLCDLFLVGVVLSGMEIG